MVRSPLFASWEVETSCILKFEKRKESVECFIKWSLPHYPNHVSMLKAAISFFPFFLLNQAQEKKRLMNTERERITLGHPGLIPGTQ